MVLALATNPWVPGAVRRPDEHRKNSKASARCWEAKSPSYELTNPATSEWAERPQSMKTFVSAINDLDETVADNRVLNCS
jgi:hypothetical protein